MNTPFARTRPVSLTIRRFNGLLLPAFALLLALPTSRAGEQDEDPALREKMQRLAEENQNQAPSPAALAEKISELLKNADPEALPGLLLEEIGEPGGKKKQPQPPAEIAPNVPAQNAELKKQLHGVDLTGVKQLKSSPDGELAAGLTELYDNPGPRSGSFSLIKIWSIKEQKLLHEFRIPGKAYVVTFSPDSSTVLAADRTGNLGYTTTIRAWDLAKGTGREISACSGEIGAFCFSPDGGQLAAVVRLGYFEMAALRETKGACVGQIKVWPIHGKGGVLSIDIPHPLGKRVEPWPPTGLEGAEVKKQFEAALRSAVPTKLRFGADGKRLISETTTEVRKVYDLK